MARIKRPEFLVFINTATKESPVFNLAGVFSEDLTFDFGANIEEIGDVTSVVKTKSVTDYAPTTSITTKIVQGATDKGYVLSNYIEGKQEALAAGADAETEVLIVKNYKQGTLETDRFGQKYDAILSFDSIGGSYDSALEMAYTLALTSEPVDGDVVITAAANGDKTAAFTAL